MAEIHVQPDETKELVARRLLDQAAHPDHVVWQPRSGVAEGGIFYVPDEEVDDLMARVAASQAADVRATQLQAAVAAVQASLPVSTDEDAGEDDEDPDEEGTGPDGPTVVAADAPGQAPPTLGEEPKLSRAEQRRLDRRKAADDAKAAEAEATPAADTTPAEATPAENTDKE